MIIYGCFVECGCDCRFLPVVVITAGVSSLVFCVVFLMYSGRQSCVLMLQCQKRRHVDSFQSKTVNFVVLRVKFSCDFLMFGFVQLSVFWAFDFLRWSCAFAGILVVLWHLPVFVAVFVKLYFLIYTIIYARLCG